MNNKARNLSVGVVVVAALAILGWLIFTVGSAPAKLFQPEQVHVTFSSERADGLGNGSNISYKGIPVGRVSSVERVPETDQVLIHASLWKKEKLPANLAGDIVFTSPIGAVSVMSLRLTGDRPQGQVAEDAKLEAAFVGSTFLPPQFAELAGTANETLRQFNRAKILETVQETIAETNKDIREANQVLHGVNTLVNDPAVRDNLTKSLAAVRATAENAQDVTTHIRSLSDKLSGITEGAGKAVDKTNVILENSGKRLDDLLASAGDKVNKLGSTLDNLKDITAKLNGGVGTAGQLINDPKLYASLVDTTKQLNDSLKSIQRLIEQWEKEGLYLKFSK